MPSIIDTLDIGAINLSLALSWYKKSTEHLYRGGFASAVWTEEPENLASVHVEVDPVNRDEVAERLGQTFGVNCIRHTLPPKARSNSFYSYLNASTGLSFEARHAG